MEKPEYHFLVCGSYRIAGDPQGICHKKGSKDLIQYLENELVDRGLSAMVSGTTCLKVCEQGPVMVLYPQGVWFRDVSESVIDQILDSLEGGTIPDINVIS